MAALLSNDDRFAKAKALQANLNSKTPPKLEILCFDFFISLAENKVSGWKKSGEDAENAFDQFPDILRTEILNYLLSEAHKMNWNHITKHFYELSCMLMNETTVKLDYADCSSYIYTLWLSKTAFEAFGKILARAASECPKLKHLAFRDGKYRRFSSRPLKNAMTPGSGIDHLLQLEQLRHLDILVLWYWTDEGLNKLCSQLKKLVTLKILIDSNASVSGIQKLKELEEFHFVVGDHPADDKHFFSNPLFRDHCKVIYNYCAQNVPSLKLIGAPTSDCADENNCTYCSHLRHITPNIKGISNLEHLHSKSTLPEAEFPNLQHLYFSGPITPPHSDKFFQKFGTFTRLTSLFLVHLTSYVIAKMLELVGTQLKTLSIHLGKTGDLFQILHFCPNLVTFKQDECRHCRLNLGGPSRVQPWVHASNYEALVTEHNVRLLERCEAFFDGLHGGKDRLFELLVFAPLMQDLRLTRFLLTKTQCQLFHNVEKGKLSKLERFKISSLDLDPACSMDDVGLFVQCLACSAPRLNYFDINRNTWNDFEVRSAHWDQLEQTIRSIFRKVVLYW